MRTDQPTYCRICEPLCGMIATVEDGRLIALRPDKEHPLSRGFACPKGIAFTEIVNDPDFYGELAGFNASALDVLPY